MSSKGKHEQKNILLSQLRQAIWTKKRKKYLFFRFSPLIKIGRSSVKEVGVGDSQELLQHAEFVTDKSGQVGVIFVADNNIYHLPRLQNRKLG